MSRPQIHTHVVTQCLSAKQTKKYRDKQLILKLYITYLVDLLTRSNYTRGAGQQELTDQGMQEDKQAKPQRTFRRLLSTRRWLIMSHLINGENQ